MNEQNKTRDREMRNQYFSLLIERRLTESETRGKELNLVSVCVLLTGRE